MDGNSYSYTHLKDAYFSVIDIAVIDEVEDFVEHESYLKIKALEFLDNHCDEELISAEIPGC